MTATVIANNGAEVKLGFEDGTFKSVKAEEIGFLAPVGSKMDIYTSQDGDEVTYIQKDSSSSNFANAAGGFVGTATDTLTNEFRQKRRVSKALYIILALFLGGIGMHKFYAHKYVLGVIYILFFWTFIPAFIAFIETIFALFKPADAEGMIEV